MAGVHGVGRVGSWCMCPTPDAASRVATCAARTPLPRTTTSASSRACRMRVAAACPCRCTSPDRSSVRWAPGPWTSVRARRIQSGPATRRPAVDRAVARHSTGSASWLVSTWRRCVPRRGRPRIARRLAGRLRDHDTARRVRADLHAVGWTARDHPGAGRTAHSGGTCRPGWVLVCSIVAITPTNRVTERPRPAPLSCPQLCAADCIGRAGHSARSAARRVATGGAS